MIAAEDTRHTGKLLKHFEIDTPLTSYFEHNKLNKLDFILEKLTGGDVALVSDAGTPAINDPGYELVQAQRQAEIVAAQAKGQGDAAREKAKGEAEATRIRADAEATYNQKVSASLTSTLIQQRYLEKWDGKLPQFSMGNSGNAPGLMLNMPMPAPAKP